VWFVTPDIIKIVCVFCIYNSGMQMFQYLGFCGLEIEKMMDWFARAIKI